MNDFYVAEKRDMGSEKRLPEWEEARVRALNWDSILERKSMASLKGFVSSCSYLISISQ